jgi:hypothetical protein
MHWKDTWPFAAAAVGLVLIWGAAWIVDRRAAPRRRCWWCKARDGAHAKDCPTGTGGERERE